MTPRSRTAVVLGVALAFLASVGTLHLTMWDPVAHHIRSNVALGQSEEFNGTVATPPTLFYDPPNPLPKAFPGTVLRSEPIADAPAGVKAWRLLYLSQNNDRQPIAISAYYVEPDRSTTKGFPLVAMAHGTTGVSRNCGMSQQPFAAGTSGQEYWAFLVRPLVQQGFAVVATDYEGMGAPGTPTYLLRKQGYDVLDSLRAALFFHPDKLDASNLGVVGHSEGGYVAIVAADMAPEYAPELMLRGSVSIAPGGVPPIPAAVKLLAAQSGDTATTPRTGYITDLSTSWAATYPKEAPLDQWLTPLGQKEIPNAAANYCQGEMMQHLTQPFTAYFKTDLPDSIITIAAKNQAATQRTTVPVLLAQGAEDTGVVPAVTRGYAVQMCALGNTVDYRQYPNDVHRSSVFASAPDVMSWLSDRFAGKPARSTCQGV